MGLFGRLSGSDTDAPNDSVASDRSGDVNEQLVADTGMTLDDLISDHSRSASGESYHFRDDLGDVVDQREGGVATKTMIPAPEQSDDDTEVVAGPMVREIFEANRANPKRPIWVGYDPDSHGFREAGLKLDQSFRHIWISGVTGSGKSTWLQNMMVQLAYAGYGFLYADPKGSDSRELLAKLPADRKDDVIIIDPTDTDHDRVVGINPLDIPNWVRDDPVELQMEVSRRVDDLEAIFAQDDYWGVNMQMIVQVLGRAMMLSERDYTIIDMFFILLSHERMENFADTVTDPFIRDAINTMVLEMDADEIRPTLKRVLSWVLDGLIRRIISHRESTVDWREVIDEDRIVILRTAVDSKDIKRMMTLSVMRGIWSAVQDRDASMDGSPPPYFVICDEFDAIASDQLDIPEMLARARSMRLSVTLACQYPSQLSEDVVKALKNNAKNRVTFTCEDRDDAKILMEAFDPYDANDLLRTDDYRVWCKLPLSGGESSQPICPRTFAPYPQLRPMSAVDRWTADSLEANGVEVLDDDTIREQLPHNGGADFDIIAEAARTAFGSEGITASDMDLDAETPDERAEQADAQRAELADDLLDDIDPDLGLSVGAGRSGRTNATATGEAAAYQGVDRDDLVAEAVLDEAIARGVTTDGKTPDPDDTTDDRPDWWIDVDQALVDRVERYTRERVATLPELNHVIDEIAGDLLKKDVDDDGRRIRTTNRGRNRAFLSGSKQNSGNGPHRDLAEDTYLLLSRLGLETTIPNQSGGADVDMLLLVRSLIDTDYSDVTPAAAARIARKRFERLQRDHPAVAYLTDGSDATGEIECSTGSTQQGQTVVNLAKAYNAGQVCVFVARPDTARSVWAALTDRPFVKQASTDDETVFYNLKKIRIDGEQPVVPDASRVKWSYDHGRDEYILADQSVRVHARFEDHDSIFSDLDAYPRSTADYDGGTDDPALGRDGPDLTVAAPVIPDRLFADGGGVDPSEPLPTPEDFRVLAIEAGAGTAFPPVDPLDAIRVVDSDGERSLRDACGITDDCDDTDDTVSTTDSDTDSDGDIEDLLL